MSDTIAGPQLPAWEVDTLGWMRDVFNGLAWSDGTQLIRAEIITGEDAILLRFPSGCERYAYLDDRPHGEPFHASRARLERALADLEDAEKEADKAEDERDEAESDAAFARDKLDDANDVISEARDLLRRINADERSAELPEWLREPIREAASVLDTSI